jgi:hypothetical protein
VRTISPYKPLSVCLAIVASTSLFLLTPGIARAQLFGNRSVGNPLRSPLERQTGASASGASTNLSEVGVLSGNERFLRGNRSRQDFVGSDRNEQSGFVGSQQALGIGRVRSATEGLQIDTTDERRINRPLPVQPDKGLYYARLDLGVVDPELIRERARGNLERSSGQPTPLQRVQSLAGNQVELKYEGRTAVLSGIAKSQMAAELVGLILSFEPGVDVVRSELRVDEKRSVRAP